MQISKVSNAEFQQNLWNGLWATQEILFIACCKLEIADQYGWNLEGFNNFWFNFPATSSKPFTGYTEKYNYSLYKPGSNVD
jgi:hypothetical protein